MAELAYVFDHNKQDTGFDICINQKCSYNRPHNVAMPP